MAEDLTTGEFVDYLAKVAPSSVAYGGMVFAYRGQVDLHDYPEVLAGVEQPSITCPVCRMTSYNPNDIREGYCGNCHDWTRG